MLSVFLNLILAIHIGPMGPNAPAREPQMAVRGSLVALAFGAGNSIYFSASHDTGRTFSDPVKVAEADVLPLSRHRGPRIAISGESIVITAVTGRRLSQEKHAHGLPLDGDLMIWHSADSGQHWSKGIRVNDVAVTNEKLALTREHLTPEGVIKLSLGKKRHVLLKPV